MPNIELSADAIRIHGQPKVLLCASLFYFRIPRENWEDRMLQLRALGYNCIDVYIPWNFHELRPGEWHLEGMHDIGAFLALAAKHGLYVVARPGPYICSEWDGGALPSWLYQQDLRLRQADDAYLTQLNRWLKKVLPLVAACEAGRGGSVIAVQLENEMDYFGCQNPKAYMEKLRDTARACGITVPLTACAGQCDVQGAYGYAQGVHPTFNAYCAADFAHLETQLAHMRKLAADADTPLMITETDREHDKLKRELAAGARLINPYNQVGGSDIDMTNGISNWAADAQKPLSLMASDYDFVSMVTVDGRLRAEAGKARLLGNLLESFGAQLALAAPCAPPFVPHCDFATAQTLRDDGRDEPCFPSLQMACGWLVGATNLGKAEGKLRFAAEGQQAAVRVQPGETKLLPWQLSLAPWGSDAMVQWAEAELYSLETVQSGLRVTFVGDADARAAVLQNGQAVLIHGESWVQVGQNTWLRVLPPEKAVLDCPLLPPLRASIPSVMRSQAVSTLTAYPFALREHAQPAGEGVRTMEAAGIYRGDVFYETELAEDSTLLLKDAADFLWASDPQGCKACYGDGASRLMAAGAGRWRLRAQAWGHSNFDDVRQPALKMGSTKGISDLVRVLEHKDITDLWYIYPEAKYALQQDVTLPQTDRILSTTINTWSYPAMPMKADFVRTLALRPDCDRFWLHMQEMGAQVAASIDGVFAGMLRANDPWLDLSAVAVAGRSVQLRLTVTRRFSHQTLGQVTLVSGQSVPQVRMYAVPVETWQRLQPQGAASRTTLPLVLRAGEEQMLTDVLPIGKPMARTLVLDGSGIEATLLAHGHVCGRVLLATDGYPEVKGGSSRRVYLTAAWADDTVRLHVCGLGSGGRLTGIRWEEIVT